MFMLSFSFPICCSVYSACLETTHVSILVLSLLFNGSVLVVCVSETSVSFFFRRHPNQSQSACPWWRLHGRCLARLVLDTPINECRCVCLDSSRSSDNGNRMSIECQQYTAHKLKAHKTSKSYILTTTTWRSVRHFVMCGLRVRVVHFLTKTIARELWRIMAKRLWLF